MSDLCQGCPCKGKAEKCCKRHAPECRQEAAREHD